MIKAVFTSVILVFIAAFASAQQIVMFMPGGSSSVPYSMEWSTTDKAAQITVSNNNLTATTDEQDSTYYGIRSSTPIPAGGKWYFEIEIDSNDWQMQIGFAQSSWDLDDEMGHHFAGSNTGWYAVGWKASNGYVQAGTDDVMYNLSTGTNYITGDVLGFAIDTGQGALWLHVDGSWVDGQNPNDGDEPLGRVWSLCGDDIYIAALLATDGTLPHSTTAITIATGANCTYSTPTGFSRIGTDPDIDRSGQYYMVSNNYGDGHCTSGGAFYWTSDYMNFGYTDDAWLIFEGVRIPQGATITTATLVAIWEGNSSTEWPFTRIYGIDEDNVSYPSDCTDVGNFSLTTSYAEWSNIAHSTDGNDVSGAPDLSDEIEEIVGRGAWVSGNRLGLFFEDTNNQTTNFASRAFSTWKESNDGLDLMPRLYIEWTE